MIEYANMADELTAFVTIAMAGRSAVACDGADEKTLVAVAKQASRAVRREVPLFADMLRIASGSAIVFFGVPSIEEPNDEGHETRGSIRLRFRALQYLRAGGQGPPPAERPDL